MGVGDRGISQSHQQQLCVMGHFKKKIKKCGFVGGVRSRGLFGVEVFSQVQSTAMKD